MHTTKILVAITAISSVGLASAAERPANRKGGLRTKRERAQKRHLANNKMDASNKMDDEDIKFWTRLLQNTDRGKGTDIGSMPIIPRPPSPTPPSPTPPVTTPQPTRRPTNPPTRRPPVPTPTPPAPTPTPPAPTPTPPAPTPTPPAFNCPPASFVGCTAPDPSDFEDECPTLGEPCVDGEAGEFCCRDACPRNYCTAKAAPGRRA